MLDLVLWVAFPYAAATLAVVVGLYRFLTDRYSWSSFSSQFLETRALFWGSVAWHYGILTILLAHVLAFLFPGLWAALIAAPVRLYVLEVAGLALALITLWGLGTLLVRRLSGARIRAVTTPMDWVLLACLLAQVALGFTVALFYRWGSDWYLHTAVPWLFSLLTLRPAIEHVVTLPLVVKLHMLGAFVIVALFPFTRLVHLVSIPVAYLWRPYQVVIWNRRPATRAPGTPA